MSSWQRWQKTGGSAWSGWPRPGGFTPDNLVTYAWWDPSDATTITSSGGDVSQFDDKKGNGRNLVQATGLDQPKTGTRTINGLNVIDYDGVDHFMTVNFGETVTQEINVYIVYQHDVATQTFFSRIFDGDAGGDQVIFGVINDGDRYINAGATAQYDPIGNTAHVYRCKYNSTTSNLTTDGAAGTPANAGTNSLETISMMAAYTGTTLSDGAVGEMIIIEGPVSAEHDAGLMTYLTDKWISPDPFTPYDINTYAWWDASEASTITSSGGDVSQWDDKKGNGKDLLQGTGLNQPKTGTRTQNSLNAIDFDGVDHFMAVAFGETLAQRNTFYMVVKSDVTADAHKVYDGIDVTDRQVFEVIGDEFRIWAGTYVAFDASDTDAHLFKADYNGVTSNLTTDGVDGTPGDAGARSIAGITLGARYTGTQLWDGLICEIIIIDGALSAADDASMNTYLSEKWGITI